MKKLVAVILMLMVMGLAFGYGSSFAKPFHNGNWVPFATIKGQYVGQPDQLKVYYNKDTLEIREDRIIVEVWTDDPQIPLFGGRTEYIDFFKPFGVWVYKTYETYNAPARPVPKNSILHLLLKTLKRANPIIDFKN